MKEFFLYNLTQPVWGLWPRYEKRTLLRRYQVSSMLTNFPSRRASLGAGVTVFLAPIALGFLGFVLGYISRGMHP